MSEENPGPESPRRSWKDRAYGLRSVAAVAVAGLIIGGGAGAAIHAATGDDGRDGRPTFGPGGGMPQPPDGMRRDGPAGPPALPGQTPPTTPPEDDDGRT